MSIWNHYSSHTDAAFEMFDSGDPDSGPFPRCPDTPLEFWRSWMTRASFAWEADGWPFWSHLYHANSFWQFRHLPNLLIVHYNDLLADLEGQMRRVAQYLGIDVAAETWPALVEAARFNSMRDEAIRQEAESSEPAMRRVFKDGARSFFFKGTNGRWRDVLSSDDLALYEKASAALDPELRSWLETGSLAAGEARK